MLTTGTCPHPPHRHREEEILLLLSGEVDLVLPEISGPEGGQLQRLQPGQFVYYPRDFAHTLRTTSEESANYLMFRWFADSRRTSSELGFGLYRACNPAATDDIKDGFSTQVIFEGPTGYLRKLHCHASILTPGQGYDPHIDCYDVAIVVLEGEVETLGERLGPQGVIFYAAGEPHGMHNPGRALARYVVFEFHGRRRRLIAPVG